MKNSFSDSITLLDIAVICSIGLFCAVLAGRGMERTNLLNLEFEKIKLKIQSKLGVLWKDYANTSDNLELPDFKHVVENRLLLGIEESLQEKILELTKIYLDLINHGTHSLFFIDIITAYGPFVQVD